MILISLLLFALQTPAGPGRADSAPAESRPKGGIRFTEVPSLAAGIDFQHATGASGKKYVAETMGSGVALFDANGDGNLDLYFLQGAPLPGSAPFDSRSRFYAGHGDWKFDDLTDPSGLANAGYAMGVAIADIDNDGNLDVYTSAYGRGHLFRNGGSARFVDITEKAGVAAEGFLSSACFGDLDNDGLVDLYITNYLDYLEVSKNPFCGKHEPGGRAYCSPHAFPGAPDFLYKNCGNAKFEDVSKAAGVARAGRVDGKGLGVVFCDFDGDGDLDIAVANDSCANFLYRNGGQFRFEEVAAMAGVAFAEDGHERAGMGIDAGDVDGDLLPDLFITNLDNEPNSLFRNLGAMMFEDAGRSSGAGPPSVPFVGFGCVLADFDGDGDLDVLIVNGHILDNAHLFSDRSSYRQRPMILVNDGKGKFTIAPRDQSFLQNARVLRGLAVGDVDHDGDLDAVATPSEGPPVLLRNESDPENARVVLRLRGVKSNRDAIGARITWTVGGTTRMTDVKTGYSYQSASDPGVVLSLGRSGKIDTLKIAWPSGTVTSVRDVGADQAYEIVEGEGPRPVAKVLPRQAR